MVCSYCLGRWAITIICMLYTIYQNISKKGGDKKGKHPKSQQAWQSESLGICTTALNLPTRAKLDKKNIPQDPSVRHLLFFQRVLSPYTTDKMTAFLVRSQAGPAADPTWQCPVTRGSSGHEPHSDDPSAAPLIFLPISLDQTLTSAEERKDKEPEAGCSLTVLQAGPDNSVSRSTFE